MTENEYQQSFEIKKFHARKSKQNKNLLALEKAHEIRKFEIELYWKRTAYFWAIIAALFGGFLLMASKKDASSPESTNYYLSLLAFTGFIFSYAWFLVNKGSKFWQENWEYHIDCLEDNITGPIHKTVLFRRDNNDIKKMKGMDYILSPESISVSKVNQLVALFTIFVWASLFLSTVFSLLNWVGAITIGFIMLFSIRLIYQKCKTDFLDENTQNTIKAHSRKTKINKP